ncbi:MAG: fructosamine kinase family protein [Actinomycetaceae bacterium]|nr:fructosamine kinase family protein [Actinomycetaceae bacterium]
MGVEKSGDVYIKTDSVNPTNTELEALSLEWLASGMQSGGAHVVPVVDVERGSISTRAVLSTRCTSDAAFQFGRALAWTHAEGSDFFGQAPTGWEGDGWMGRSELTYVDRPGVHDGWGDFYAQERILPHLPIAVDNGAIDKSGMQVVERLCERLRDRDFDTPQPALVRDVASRIHGDLWTGNVIWTRTSELDWAPEEAGFGSSEEELPEVVGVLIDPAAHGGHAEKDLADLGVFGQPHWEQIYAGYNEESPLESGWQERIGLHQLHILMVHANLFGGSYGYEAVLTAKKYI